MHFRSWRVRPVLIMAITVVLLLGLATPASAAYYHTWGPNYYSSPLPTKTKVSGSYYTYFSGNFAYSYINSVSAAFQRTSSSYYVSAFRLGCRAWGFRASDMAFTSQEQWGSTLLASKPAYTGWTTTYSFRPTRVNWLCDSQLVFSATADIRVASATTNATLATYRLPWYHTYPN